jgi:hypothetical protein
MRLQFSFEVLKLFFASSEFLLMSTDQRHQCIAIKLIYIWNSGAIHARKYGIAYGRMHQKRCVITRASPASSDRDFRCPGSLDSSPVDAFQKHRKLRTRKRDRAALGLRPYKSPLLQTLGEKAETVAIEPEALNHVASSAAKEKDVTGVWLLL